MIKRVLVLSAFLAIALVYQSCDSTLNIDEPYDKYYLKYIGTDGDQSAVDLAVDGNGNNYVLGITTSNSDGDQIYVVKTSPRGDVQWQSILGEAGKETARDLELMANGNVAIVADRTDLGTGEQDFVIYIVDGTTGAVIGTPRTGGYPGATDRAHSITETADGFIVSVSTDRGGYRDASIFRYQADLLQFGAQWNVQFGQDFAAGGYDVVPVKVHQLDANTFVTFCYTNSTLFGDTQPDYNVFIWVSGQNNDLIRAYILNSTDPQSDERITSVMPIPAVSGSGFVIAGYSSNPTSGTQDVYLQKIVRDLATTGNPTDTDQILQGPPKTITSGLSSVSSSAPLWVYPSNTTGFLVLASQNNQGSDDIFLTRVDNNLNDAWPDRPSFTLGGVGSDAPGGLVETNDGRILLAGTMVIGEVNGQRKIALIKLSSGGMFGE